MDRRRFLLTSLAGALAAPAPADPQTAGNAVRVGFLGQTSASAQAPAVEALRAGLRAFGYVEGDNLVIEFRWAEGNYERFADLAAELVRLKVDVLVTGGTATIRAAKHTTTTIPVVMISSGDAVATGLVDSLARPGGNITGSTFFVPELKAKRLELLKEAVPRARRIAVLVNPDDPSKGPVLKAMEMTAGSLRIGRHTFEARRRNGIETAFSAMGTGRMDAVVVQEDAFLAANDPVIADLAVKKRLPSAGSRRFVEAGGHIGYGPNGPDMARRAAYFVERILRGARPGDLPVERPTKFDLIVNRKTAKTLGLTVPPSLLARADQVIE
jgi:putative ABC transport system substrate-binding protein